MILYPRGNAKPRFSEYSGCAVISDNVIAGNAISANRMLLAGVALLAPLLINILPTEAVAVPVGLNVIFCTYHPSVASAVNTVRTVPVPSLAVLAVVMSVVPHWTSATLV